MSPPRAKSASLPFPPNLSRQKESPQLHYETLLSQNSTLPPFPPNSKHTLTVALPIFFLEREREREREMSGWDEGGVYYSDQAHSWRDGRGGTDDPEAAASRHSVLQKLKEFIRGFETDKNVFPYRESLVHNPKSLLVDMEDLDAFDPDLPSKLRSAPADYLPLVNHLSLCLLPFPNLWKLCFFFFLCF